MKLIQYRIDHTEKIIYERFKGKISQEDFINHQESILKDSEYNPSYHTLSDIRDASYTFSEEIKSEIFSQMRSLLKNKKSKGKCAFITHKPFEVVDTLTFSDEMKNSTPVEYKTFSTEEAALEWLVNKTN